MSFAPSGPLATLPDEWQDRVHRYSRQNHGVVAPLVEYIAKVVSLHGDRSIGLQQVQQMAAWSCSDAAVPVQAFPGHLDVFRRLTRAAGGPWPVEIPLDEYFSEEKSIDQVAKDLDSIHAEWLVLDRLVVEGWQPVKTNRAPGVCDWKIEKAGRGVDVDAKYKATVRSCHARLTWMLRGAAMLPSGSCLRQFSWSWSVPTDCRDPTVRACFNLFFEGLAGLQLLLDTFPPESEQTVVHGDGGQCLQLEQFDEGLDLTFVTQSGNVQLSGHPNPGYPHLFSPGGAQADYARTPSDEMRDELGKVIHRLKLKKTDPCLFVVLWDVPFTWESDWNPAQVSIWWNELSHHYSWPSAILWPVGNFEAAGAPWVPNSAAAEVLGA